MNVHAHYAMLIQWSERDNVFVVTLPEWEGRVLGPVTHGDSYEEAAQRGHEVPSLLIEETLESGNDLPEPSAAVAIQH